MSDVLLEAIRKGGVEGDARAVMRFALAQLDYQLQLLKKRTSNLSPEELSWQIAPGSNTIGMLLTHMAISEVCWMYIAEERAGDLAEEDKLVRSVLGISSKGDGLPLPKGGQPPAALESKALSDYWKLLDQARTKTHEVTASWTDGDLRATFEIDGKPISNVWILYHVLEHHCGHTGQIEQIRAMRRRSMGG